jgi:hypothetical protein
MGNYYTTHGVLGLVVHCYCSSGNGSRGVALHCDSVITNLLIRLFENVWPSVLNS